MNAKDADRIVAAEEKRNRRALRDKTLARLGGLELYKPPTRLIVDPHSLRAGSIIVDPRGRQAPS